MLIDIKIVFLMKSLSSYIETKCAFQYLLGFNLLLLFVIPVDCAKQLCEWLCLNLSSS